MLPISRKISAYNFSRGNNVQYIVIHDVGNASTAKNNVDYFSGGDRQSSAHYFVDDTSIWQSVEESNAAWHCGDGRGKYGIKNSNSIGIEMCLPSGTVSTKTEENTIELVKYLMNKYGIDANHVVRHYDASRKNCPAQFNLDGKWTRWNNFKAKLTGQSSPSSPEVSNPPAGGGIQVGGNLTNKVTYQKTDCAVNVRLAQTTASKVLKTLPKGTVFKSNRYADGENVDGKGYKWFEYESGGWIYGANITPTSAPSSTNWISQNGKFKLNTAIKLRTGASTNSSVITTLPTGSIVNYDAYCHVNGYVWIRQKRGNSYGYLATGKSVNGKRQNYWGTFY